MVFFCTPTGNLPFPAGGSLGKNAVRFAHSLRTLSGFSSYGNKKTQILMICAFWYSHREFAVSHKWEPSARMPFASLTHCEPFLGYHPMGTKKTQISMICAFWYSHRESNPELTLRRGLLYPFNYGSIY